MTLDLLGAALNYAARGFSVLPLVPGGKEPLGRLVRRGHREASTDPERLREWWGAVPEANVGVVCGPLSFDVLDVDGPEGLASMGRLVSLHTRIVTRIHRTPRGWHLLFKPGDLPTTAGRIGPGLDTRGGGTGYIVVPPSRSSSGVYREAVRAELSEAPSWLVELARSPKARSHSFADSVSRVRGAPKGQRNTTLNREAFITARDAPSYAEAAEAAASLIAASRLPNREAVRTARSALWAGRGVADRRSRMFRRIPTLVTSDPRFRGRSPEAKLVALLICAGEGATAIPGVAVSSPRVLAEEASLSEQGTRDALRELAQAGLLRSDIRAGLLWIPSVTGRFRPESTNVVKAWSNALGLHIPRCGLHDAIAEAVHELILDARPTARVSGR